jgi:hypothetical protein
VKKEQNEKTIDNNDTQRIADVGRSHGKPGARDALLE